MAQGGWEHGGWRRPSHMPWLHEGPQVPPEHWCTIAAGGGAEAECSQRGLGGNTIRDNEENERDERKTGRYWLSDSFGMSSPLGREVRFHQNSLITLADGQEGAQQGKTSKTELAGGEGKDKQRHEEQCQRVGLCVQNRRKGEGRRHGGTEGETWQVGRVRRSRMCRGQSWPLRGDTLGWVWNWKPLKHSWLLKASLWEPQFIPTLEE